MSERERARGTPVKIDKQMARERERWQERREGKKRWAGDRDRKTVKERKGGRRGWNVCANAHVHSKTKKNL